MRHARVCFLFGTYCSIVDLIFFNVYLLVGLCSGKENSCVCVCVLFSSVFLVSQSCDFTKATVIGYSQ